jgi:hypothetical protein
MVMLRLAASLSLLPFLGCTLYDTHATPWTMNVGGDD